MTALTDQSRAKAGRTVISVDAMGGDAGPTVVVAGLAAFAQDHPEAGILLPENVWVWDETGRTQLVLAALPTLIVYIVSGRYFVRGLMAGAVKG